MTYTMGSLFAGIGGFDLGFERAGFKTVWQVEIDPYCQKVLANNFPEAKRFGDIRECGIHNLEPVDVICGGFPCQDISNAGKREGITGEKSRLWAEYARIIGELRPKFVVVENVAALLGRGMGVVLGDLSEIGYDADWAVISAADVGAPHLRERIWIVAYPQMCRRNEPCLEDRKRESYSCRSPREIGRCGCFERDVFHAAYYSTNGEGVRRSESAGQWGIEPNMGRVAHGVPNRVDRLRGLGNAVVPQIPELIARYIKRSLEKA